MRAARVPWVTLTRLHLMPLETHGLRRSSREEKYWGKGAGRVLSVLTSARNARELPAAGDVTSASPPRPHGGASVLYLMHSSSQ